ncbi:MAG: hypothetical protein C5B59_08540 [Bacteroidetes bacterium]|nr:MAG: hypothetical protein C5B59_08540 [Bacteroidota bacterium]
MNKDCDKKAYLKQNEMPKDKFGAEVKQKAPKHTSEHETIMSRTTGRKHEIQFGPVGGGLVPANPFASLAQAGYMHAHPEVLGKKKLAEFDAATKGKKLPKHVK